MSHGFQYSKVVNEIKHMHDFKDFEEWFKTNNDILAEHAINKGYAKYFNEGDLRLYKLHVQKIKRNPKYINTFYITEIKKEIDYFEQFNKPAILIAANCNIDLWNTGILLDTKIMLDHSYEASRLYREQKFQRESRIPQDRSYWHKLVFLEEDFPDLGIMLRLKGII